eukprot:TRINITY_DN127541_c0_g1_i1.p1 TRINITY_DN127541_c0_g1~~TRINITY_DN127541_c0_g1_i1.p1  ORF type:complete len:147 (-),score=4.75 TRINITY_DN127541_c0_g1_i1:6-446(-)
MAPWQEGPRLAAWTQILSLRELQGRFESFAVATVVDPDFREESLEVIVQAGVWHPGDRGILLAQGAQVKPCMVKGHWFEKQLVRNDWEVNRIFMGKDESHGFLFHLASSVDTPGLPVLANAPSDVDLETHLGIQRSATVVRRIVLQ